MSEPSENQPAGVKRKIDDMVCASDRVEEMGKAFKRIKAEVDNVAEIAVSFVDAMELCLEDIKKKNTDPLDCETGISKPAEEAITCAELKVESENVTSPAPADRVVIEISDSETDNEDGNGKRNHGLAGRRVVIDISDEEPGEEDDDSNDDNDKENRHSTGLKRLPFDPVRDAAASMDNDEEDKESVDPALLTRLPFDPILPLNLLTQGFAEEDVTDAAVTSNRVVSGGKVKPGYTPQEFSEGVKSEKQDSKVALVPASFIYVSSDDESSNVKKDSKAIRGGDKNKPCDTLIDLTLAVESENEDTSEAPVPGPFIYISDDESDLKKESPPSPIQPTSSPLSFAFSPEMDRETKLVLATIQLQTNTIDVFPRMIDAAMAITDEIEGLKTSESTKPRLTLKLNPASRPTARSPSLSSNDTAIEDIVQKIAQAERTLAQKVSKSKMVNLSIRQKLAAMPDLRPQVEAMTNNTPFSLTRAQADRAVKAANEGIAALGVRHLPPFRSIIQVKSLNLYCV
ncbi:uncharacterized protein DSM5745_02721 [Aspergillus mulundensis]|uniref:Uncharacterized protein n=1 Tax=Aspergillus mulundensis TaxID=1810919 RepID=A0A3D8SIB8_9EURO|nr:hypothetical protein DSM5745_02721 [Aspergillus mulundensis]RDW86079.1 hypothetical protein DSM5745_02721 [Aspergillus mulundensis]